MEKLIYENVACNVMQINVVTRSSTVLITFPNRKYHIVIFYLKLSTFETKFIAAITL